MTVKHNWLPDKILHRIILDGPFSLTDIRDAIILEGEHRPSRSTIKRHVVKLIEEGLLQGAGRDCFNAQTYRETTAGQQRWMGNISNDSNTCD